MTGQPGVDGGAVIFLHIPKTGGMTLSQVLERQYRPWRRLRTEGDQRALEAALRSLPKHRRARIRLVYGHIMFGVHEVLPTPARYLTMVREPIDRAISHYYFVRRTPHHRLYEEVTSRDMSLADYVESRISNELVNGQACLIAGPVGGRWRRPDDPEVLEAAKRNIARHFALVGINERFDESLLLAREMLGWTRPINYTRENVTLQRPSRQEIPASTLSVIQQHSRLDIELYRFAGELHEAAIKARGQDFQLRLQAFRHDNAENHRVGLGGRAFDRAARSLTALKRAIHRAPK